ncbi:MAG: guanylate kinase [Vampirovibrionales bacterium]
MTLLTPHTPKVIVLSGPSGTGKGTLVKRMLEKRPDIQLSVSATTRSQREGEVHGKDYWFYTKEAFEKQIEDKGFLEWATYNGQYYGTPEDKVRDALAQGKHVLLEIEVQGAFQVLSRFAAQAWLIFLHPPSLEVLRERLITRGREPLEEIERRLAIAAQEQPLAEKFHHQVVNHTLEQGERDLLFALPPAMPPVSTD